MLSHSKRYLILALILSATAFADTLSINAGGADSWMSTVPNASMLPISGNVDGAARIALDTKGLYSYDIATNNWVLIASPAAATALTALTGDVHVTGPGAAPSTIQPNVVTNAKLAQMPTNTIKGNNTGGTANAIDLTAAQVFSMLGLDTAATKAISFFQTALGYTPEDVANKSTNTSLGTSDTLYPSQKAVKSYVDSSISGVGAGLPLGVYPTEGNKIDFRLSKDGLLIQSYNTPAFTAGAFNGGGTGSKGIVGFDNYNAMAFSSLTALGFTARSVRDELPSTIQGNIYWNLLANFNSGALTTANDYVNLVLDGLEYGDFTKYYILTNSHAAYSPNLSTSRAFKAVGGTGVINVTASCTSGQNFVTGVANTSALTVGMYFKRDPQGSFASGPESPLIDGTTIIGINLDGANTVRVSNNCSATIGPITFKQYGGIAPVSRAGTCNGTTTISGITNTADLQTNMLVNDGGSLIPTHSFIVSMVANTSITLNNACSTGSPTVNFVAAGKTGIPSNAENVGITWAKILALNPNGYFANTAPTVAGGWAAADGGWPKNSVQAAFNLVQGGSSTLDARINSVKNSTINTDVYTFAP